MFVKAISDKYCWLIKNINLKRRPLSIIQRKMFRLAVNINGAIDTAMQYAHNQVIASGKNGILITFMSFSMSTDDFCHQSAV